MNPKDFIEQAKDYADVADASYAMLHYIKEDEEILSCEDIDKKFKEGKLCFRAVE